MKSKSKIPISSYLKATHTKFIIFIAITVFSLGLFSFISSPKNAQAVGPYYARSTGGNWGDASTWSLTSGGGPTGSVPTASDDVIFDNLSGNVTINSASVAKSVTFNGGTGYSGILTHNGYSLTVSGSATFVSGMTYTPLATSTLVFNSTATLTTGGKLMPNVSVTSGALTLGDNLSFMASQIITLTHSSTSAINQNGKTIAGNSSTNRVLIKSNTVGTGRTITVAGGTYANADFQDIIFANGGNSLDLSSITGLSGDCGGNSISGGGTLTFTSPSTETFASTSGSWSDVGKWTSRVPLPQDLARFQAMSSSQTITIDMPRLPNSDFSSVTNTPTILMNTSGLTYTAYGSLILTGVGTFTCPSFAGFISRSDITVTSNSKILGSNASGFLSVYVVGATLTLSDNFSTSHALWMKQTNGTLTTNSNVSIRQMIGVGAINMGSGTWTVTGGTSFWDMTQATVNPGTSTIALSSSGTTFAGGTNTYNNITVSPSLTALTFSGAFTFSNLTMSSAGAKTIKFTKNTIYTMTGNNFLSGTSGNLITISSDTAGQTFTLNKTSGVVISDYISLQDSIISGDADWFAGPLSHSTNVSGNSGWKFETPVIVSSSGGNWSSASSWSGGVVPTSADSVVATTSSGNLTIDSASSCGSLNFSDFTGSLIHNSNSTLSVGNSSAGNFSLGDEMTYTASNELSSVISFVSTTTGNEITWAGNTAGSVTFDGIGGGWTFQDVALIGGNLTVANSDTNSLGVNLNNFTTNIGGDLQIENGKLTAGSSSITLGGDWSINQGSFVASSSTVVFSGAGSQSIVSNGNSFYNLTVSNASTTGVIFSDSVAVSNIFSDSTNYSKLTFNSGSTYTFHEVNIAANNSQSRIIMQASGSANWIFSPTIITQIAYVDVSRSTFVGSAFCATYSHDSGNNLNWSISDSLSCWDKNYIKLFVDSTTHNDYGLAYPITHEFSIPSGSANLQVFKRYSTNQTWTQIAEKTNNDFFNGIEAVRFDYSGNKVYVSVAFDSSSDEIYLKATNAEDQTIDLTYIGIPEYYDNRKAAALFTADDWSDSYNTKFKQAADAFSSRSIWFTPAIITGTTTEPTWTDIQTKIDSGYIEPAAHSKNHTHTPYADYDAEVGDSKTAIIDNLNLPSLNRKGTSEYLYAWVAPYGDSDTTVRSKLGINKYLADVSGSFSYNYGSFTILDIPNGLYNRWNRWSYIESETESSMNSKWDTDYAAGSIYHIGMHPALVDWSAGSAAINHLDYIKGKKDVWYAGMGHAYLYHYLDDQNKIIVQKTGESTPVSSIFSPSSSATDENINNLSSFTTIPADLSDVEIEQVIIFNASYRGSDVAKYQWSFGDGSTITGAEVEHKYEVPGRYIATLTTTDQAGSKSATSKVIDIKPPVPTISNIKADNTSVVFEGRSYPGTSVTLNIHSDPYVGKTLADKDGNFRLVVENGKDVLGENEHTVVANAIVVLSDGTEIKSRDSKAYSFTVSFEDGKLIVTMGNTDVWRITTILLLTVLVAVGAIFARKNHWIKYPF